MIKTIESWVIHKRWSGDTSAKVCFFTAEFGLIECHCKGGRTPKKQALLQTFSPLWLSIETRYGLFYSKTIESISPSLSLSGQALFSALYLNEILYYALKSNYPDPALFHAYVYALKGFSMTRDRYVLESLLRRFEWVLLKSCGYAFSWTHEARTNQLIVEELYYHFIAEEGFMVAKEGIPGFHILALAKDNFHEVAYLQSAKLIMRKAIAHLLGGREIKTRTFFPSLASGRKEKA